MKIKFNKIFKLPYGASRSTTSLDYKGRGRISYFMFVNNNAYKCPIEIWDFLIDISVYFNEEIRIPLNEHLKEKFTR